MGEVTSSRVAGACWLCAISAKAEFSAVAAPSPERSVAMCVCRLLQEARGDLPFTPAHWQERPLLGHGCLLGTLCSTACDMAKPDPPGPVSGCFHGLSLHPVARMCAFYRAGVGAVSSKPFLHCQAQGVFRS